MVIGRDKSTSFGAILGAAALLFFGGACSSEPVSRAADQVEGTVTPEGTASATEDSTRNRLPVQIDQVRRDDVYETIELTGKAVAWEEFVVTSEIAGRVVGVHADRGDTVREGELLVELDRERRELELSSLKAQRERARRELDFAEMRLNQGEALIERGAMSPLEVETLSRSRDLAEAEFRVASLAIESMERELRDTLVLAPAAGTVTSRNVSNGAMAQPGMTLLTLLQTRPLLVVTEVGESYLHKLRPEQPARLHFDSVPGSEKVGRIQRIHPAANPQTGLFPVEIRIENRNDAVQPGMLASLQLQGEAFPGSLIVPLNAVVEIGGSMWVFVVTEDGIAERRSVEILRRIRNEALVDGPLQPGEHVVTRGNFNLTGGTPVQIVD